MPRFFVFSLKLRRVFPVLLCLTAVLLSAACAAATNPATTPMPTSAEPETIPTETAMVAETAENEEVEANPTEPAPAEGDGLETFLNTLASALAAQTVVDLESFSAAPFGGPAPAPVFSPDGNRIALHRLTDRPETTGLVLYETANGASVFVAQNGGRPAWLNNEIVLFTAYDENFNGAIQQYHVATGERLAIPLPTLAELVGIRPSPGN